ncbi:MAG: transglycosylase domain-containing protein [Patescibacteria group bacterium]
MRRFFSFLRRGQNFNRFFLFPFFVFFFAFSLFLIFLFRSLPTIEQIRAREVSESTKIYDRTGEVLLYEINAGERRTVASLVEIPDHLEQATIAIEDEKFYTEPAFDLRGIVRAFVVNLRHGEIRQGGSTITQQLARNAFLSPEKTVSRKLRELMLAVRLSENYTKDQILELYLNEIPYGSTLYGAEAASRAYFGKPVHEISLRESSILAALPQAPSYYSPWGSRASELLRRANVVLRKMKDLGFITDAQYKSALSEPVRFMPQSTQSIKAPHFVFAVQDHLVQKYGEDAVQKGGLRVITTLDWNLQEIAEKTVKEGAENNERLYKGKNAALVAEDPKTGQILALVGSRDYFDIKNEGNFNVALQGLRQPGSSLKPFVYLNAFMKGYTPETVVFDVPTEFSSISSCPAKPDFSSDPPQCFHPENFDQKFRGPVSFRNALAQSINVPAVKVLYLAGISDTVRLMNSLGLATLTNPERYGLSLVLGGGAVRLVDLVKAYSVLSQEGVLREQSFVMEVRDRNGEVLESYINKEKIVLEPQLPRLVNSILTDVEARSGLLSPSSLALTVFSDHEVALKTGTSNDYVDAWAVGYTPSLVVGVWAGNNDSSAMQKQGSSILAAIPTWSKFFGEALKTVPSEIFSKPDPVFPEKNILRGNYLEGSEVHSILYFVDKKNPLGPPPQNPASDSQFLRWEFGVLSWAKDNLGIFSPVQQDSASDILASQKPLFPPQITVVHPSEGSFTNTNPVSIVANLKSSAPMKTIRVYFNERLVQSFLGSFGTSYELRFSFSAPLFPQNILSVEAEDESGSTGKSFSILY